MAMDGMNDEDLKQKRGGYDKARCAALCCSLVHQRAWHR